MGRAGSGSSRSSSSHSSSSRSSSGHHVSSGRSGSSYSGGYSRNRSYGRSSGTSFFGSRRRKNYYDTYVPGVSYYNDRPAIPTWIIVVILILITFFLLGISDGSISVERVEGLGRTKLISDIAFNPNCIVDEIGYFDHPNAAGNTLREFYDLTGMQPYIVLRNYDRNLTSDNQKQQYAEQWYEDNIDNEFTILYMYFETDDPDNEVGYMSLIGGSKTKILFDSIATEKFWDYIDAYWYDDSLSTDEMFKRVFNYTAQYMTRSDTYTNDTSTGFGAILSKVLTFAAIVVGVLIIGFVIIRVAKTIRKHNKEKNQEIQNILNTPIEKVQDPLLDKYKNK